MRWQGQVVGFVGALAQVLPEGRSVFTMAPWQFVTLRPQAWQPLPRAGEQVLVAGRVEGTMVIDLPLGGHVPVPELTAVAITPAVPPAHWAEWTEEPRVRLQTMTYDTQSQLRDTAFYNADGQLRWRWRFTYTPQGRRSARISTDTADVPRWTLRYIYDTAGRLRETVELAADQSLARRWEYHYNDRGFLLQESNYDAQGTLLWQWQYTYDTQGQRTAESSHAADGTLLWRRQYLYETPGQMTEERYYDATHTLMWKRLYTYDSHGNRIEDSLYKADGTLESRWRYTYAAYDAYGNWLQRTESKWRPNTAPAELEPVQVTYRTLLYH
jgi:YD repeat-containing protein